MTTEQLIAQARRRFIKCTPYGGIKLLPEACKKRWEKAKEMEPHMKRITKNPMTGRMTDIFLGLEKCLKCPRHKEAA